MNKHLLDSSVIIQYPLSFFLLGLCPKNHHRNTWILAKISQQTVGARRTYLVSKGLTKRDRVGMEVASLQETLIDQCPF